MKIAWYGKHFGEEPPICGNETQGAGTIFFSGCNLRCVFCQNYQISQQNLGREVSVEELADMMIELQNKNAATIDLVTPTIWWREIKEGIALAKEKGLRLPIVWNSNAFESVEIIKKMTGFVDIYLPDFKYGDNVCARKYSGIENYVETAIAAIAEMQKQVGDLEIGENGVAKKGVIIRHLILPSNIESSLSVLNIIAEKFPQIPVSLMRQYFPLHLASNFEEINRKVSEAEFQVVFERLIELKLDNGWVQEADSEEIFVPDFTKVNPFQK